MVQKNDTATLGAKIAMLATQVAALKVDIASKDNEL